MSDFFVIAEEELVVSFRLAGVDGRAVANRDEALESFLRHVGQGGPSPGGPSPGADASGKLYPKGAGKVLILSEDIADMIEEQVLEWQMGGEYPLIVEVPSPGGRREGRKSLVDAVREAVGISV
ncbi:MAG: ATPase V [Spirochaetes bacterium]|nr:ATPase V [Spirochaetota bacterium]